MSETEIMGEAFLGRWIVNDHGLTRCDVESTEVQVLVAGSDRILTVLRGGVVLTRCRLPAEAANHLAALLRVDARGGR